MCWYTCFPSEWKNDNIVPIHKKMSNKHWTTFAQIVSRICRKVLERLMFREMFIFFFFFLKINLSRQSAIFKLTQNRISENLLKLLHDFLSERRKRHSSQWSSLHIDKCHCWSTARFHPWSIIFFNLHK